MRGREIMDTVRAELKTSKMALLEAKAAEHMFFRGCWTSYWISSCNLYRLSCF
jgi:hypothetical protein